MSGEEIEKLKKEIDILKKRSESRENLLEKIMESNEPLESFPNEENFLVLAREWNSWYPSSYNVAGGCYFLNLNKEIFIIDPGFNTLDFIIEKDLDIRLIHHVFITHFHPDHFESLIKLITRLTSEEHQLTIYLNLTTLEQFKIYLKANTEFIGLTPGSHIIIKSGDKNNDLTIKVDVNQAHHREIAGFMNSINLKFNLHFNDSEKEYKIGFMSDTDGLNDYIEEYTHFFEDCDILIPHIGAIHKEPTGYKHLYLSGIETLLTCMKVKGQHPFIFLGEFGLELATDDQFYTSLENVISEKISYNILVKNIVKLIKMHDNENEALLTLLIRKFESIIDKLPIGKLLSLEILTPFFDEELLSQKITLKSIIQIFHEKFNQDFYLKFLWSKLARVIFDYEVEYEKQLFLGGFDFQGLIPPIYSSDPEWIYHTDVSFEIIDAFKIIFNLLKHKLALLIPYLDIKFSKNLLNKFKSLIIFNRSEFNKDELKSLIPKIGVLINVDRYESYDNFKGIEPEIYESFSNNELSSKSLILSYFLLVMQELDNYTKNSRKKTIENTPDGRESICKYLSKKYAFDIIPVHSSYIINFRRDDIYLNGRCEIFHENSIKLINYNRSWRIIRKNKGYISVIKDEDCPICFEEIMFQKSEEKQNLEYLNDFEVDRGYQEYVENIQTDIENATYMYDFFQIVCNHQNAIEEVDYNVIINKIIFLKKNLKNKELILYLIHPFFIKNESIFSIIKQELEHFSEEQVIDLLKDMMNNVFPYLETTNDLYLKLLDNDDFARIIIDKIENIVDFNLILDLIHFYYLKKIDSFIYPLYGLFYQFFIKEFIEIFFQIIDSPNKHQEKIQYLKNKYHIIIEELPMLGDPFIYYAGTLSRIVNPRYSIRIDYSDSIISFLKPKDIDKFIKKYVRKSKNK